MQALQRSAASQYDLLLVRKAASQPASRVRTEDPTGRSDCHQGTLALEGFTVEKPGVSQGIQGGSTVELTELMEKTCIHMLYRLVEQILSVAPAHGTRRSLTEDHARTGQGRQTADLGQDLTRYGDNQFLRERQPEGSDTIPTRTHPELGHALRKRLARTEQGAPCRWEKSQRVEKILGFS